MAAAFTTFRTSGSTLVASNCRHGMSASVQCLLRASSCCMASVRSFASIVGRTVPARKPHGRQQTAPVIPYKPCGQEQRDSMAAVGDRSIDRVVEGGELG